MKFSSMTIAALIAAIPAMSVADPIFPVAPTQSVSASLSASFGEGANLTSPSSISVSAAAGLMAVSTGVATGVSSATSAGSSAAAELLPSAVIAFNDVSKSYETEIAFQKPLNVQDLIDAAIDTYDTDIQAQIDAIEADIAAICENGFDVDTDLTTEQLTFRVGILSIPLPTLDIEGEVTVTCTVDQPE